MDLKEAVKKIHWLGHGAIRIDESTVLLVDPFGISIHKAADLILISHDDLDCNLPEEVAKSLKANSVIVAGGASGQKLRNHVRTFSLGGRIFSEKLKGEVKVVAPGEKLRVKGARIAIGPVYGPQMELSPNGADALSFVFTLAGVRYYHPGNAHFVPEAKPPGIDIAFLPVSETCVTTAVDAAKQISPAIVIPIHYAPGSEHLAKEFERALEARSKVVILQREEIMLIGGG